MLSLIADQSRWKDLGGGFRGEQARLSATDFIVGVVLIVGSVLVVWVLSRMMARQSGRAAFNSPPALFQSLCAAHELSRADRRLLAKLARTSGVAQPAQLFLEPQRFAEENLTSLSHSQRSQASALRQKLFYAGTVS